jgi:hypothetical protein
MSRIVIVTLTNRRQKLTDLTHFSSQNINANLPLVCILEYFIDICVRRSRPLQREVSMRLPAFT